MATIVVVKKVHSADKSVAEKKEIQGVKASSAVLETKDADGIRLEEPIVKINTVKFSREQENVEANYSFPLKDVHRIDVVSKRRLKIQGLKEYLEANEPQEA